MSIFSININMFIRVVNLTDISLILIVYLLKHQQIAH